jgi:hypothetical protein
VPANRETVAIPMGTDRFAFHPSLANALGA